MNKTIIKLLTFLGLALALFACDSPPNPNPEVRHYGALKRMMHDGDISANISLDTIFSSDHLYGLGAVDQLKGEILVWDGEFFIAQKKDEELEIVKSNDFAATLFVCAEVSDWEEFELPSAIKTYEEFENYIKQFAASQGLDTHHPFPFLVEGRFKKAEWHVIDWPAGDMEHNHDKHINSGLRGKLEGEELMALGFYSEHHHGVFTHHSRNTHIHVRTTDDKISAHLDDFVLGDGIVLKLPKLGR